MSQDRVSSADLLVVVGPSGTVYPAATLPHVALAANNVVFEVNPDRRRYPKVPPESCERAQAVLYRDFLTAGRDRRSS